MATYPNKQEITIAITRCNLVIKIIDQLIGRIEETNSGNNNWFVFSEKIGRKYLSQAYTLQQIFQYDFYLIKNAKQQRFVDFSSMFVLLRTLLETYAVFFHLFVDNCSIEEKIIRFRLWELDGLRIRQKYTLPEDALTRQKIEKEKVDIENCIKIIKQFDYFKKLEVKNQEFLIEKAAWRFTNNSLMNKDHNKKRLSIEQMTLNTGLKKALFENWYSFASTHTHTTYWSVVQSDTLTNEEKITSEYVAIMQASFITSFFIKDFCKIYDSAELFYNSLPSTEREIVDSFDLGGRN